MPLAPGVEAGELSVEWPPHELRLPAAARRCAERYGGVGVAPWREEEPAVEAAPLACGVSSEMAATRRGRRE